MVEKAKRKASSQGISLSKMIENIFEKEDPELEKNPGTTCCRKISGKTKKTRLQSKHWKSQTKN
ncbi:DUF6364 family protein [Algoriphagus boritolerans]|uniref:DUF6364 family protein n=1 Tax=Algoriphagus boritolerans TaxID=308111 RepID=UPI003A0FC881